ncbi:hypothetical protein KUTeg_002057 [Tegillarca granosa]|uniref:ADAMTS cysteine-rich domain-containing protein n=1 Tax=Tegillarca granosa TaxID=220873 RepID=A0ABQ9FW04_TEGGR|nr:hypothetical protein KUTeg_002057 [Tegillarca granosa]
MTGVWKFYLSVLVVVFFCVLEHVCIKLSDSVQSKYEEAVFVKIKDLVYSNSQIRNKRSSDMFPQSFTVRFNIKEEPVHLKMKRTEHLSIDIPTYIHNGDGIITPRQVIQDECGFYQDRAHMASITMECLQAVDNKCNFTLYGTFIHKGEQFILEETTSKGDNNGNKPSYRILQPVNSVDLGNDYVVLPELNQHYEGDRPTRRRRATGVYQVELLWYDKSTAPNLSEQKKNDAYNNIRKVYATLLNGMDLRYSNLPGYTLNINYAGIYVAETENSTSYIESINSSTLPVTVDANTTLTGFHTWVTQNLNLLPKHDHAMLFTNLGAIHDGDENSCQRNSKYIMSVIVSASQGAYAYHPWEFSSCSKSEMTSHIDAITKNHITVVLAVFVPVYGVMMSILYVLQEPYNGSFSSVCTGLWCYDVKSVTSACVLIIPGRGTTCGDKKWCINGICTSSNDAPSVVGTCIFGDTPGIYSNGQTCQQAVASTPWKCYESTFNNFCCQSCRNIYNATNTDCVYGDRADCSQITWGFPCYNNDNERSCCGTCAKYATQIPDCKYGDKAQGCVRNSCTRYTVTDYTNCCQSCYNVMTTTTQVQGTGPGATTGATVGITTGGAPGSSLPSWVIPAAAGSGGALLLIIIIITCYCCCRSSENNDEKILKKLQKERNLTNLNQPYPQRARTDNTYSYASHNKYNRQRHDIPRGYVGSNGQRGNITDRGTSVKSNVSDEHVYLDIIPPPSTYKGLQNRQGQGHNNTSNGQAYHPRGGRRYTNSDYIHPC